MDGSEQKGELSFKIQVVDKPEDELLDSASTLRALNTNQETINKLAHHFKSMEQMLEPMFVQEKTKDHKITPKQLSEWLCLDQGVPGLTEQDVSVLLKTRFAGKIVITKSDLVRELKYLWLEYELSRQENDLRLSSVSNPFQ